MSDLHTLAVAFAKHILSTNTPVEDYTFVFPNRRAGLFFRKYLAQQFPKPILAPAVLPISQVFTELTDLTLESEIDTLLRLYDIYVHLFPQHEPLSDFIPWGKRLLGDFSDIDNHLVSNVQALFTYVKDLHTIDTQFDYLSENQRKAIQEFWTTALTEGKMQQHFLDLWQQLYPLYTSLRESLLKDKKAYSGLLNREVVEHFADIPEKRFHKHYVFIGFNALTASEERLFVLLRDKGIADFYFDYDNPFARDDENRASLFRDHNLRLFHPQLTLPTSTEGQPHFHWFRVPGEVAQTYKIHELLTEIYPTPSEEYARTAVVLPEEKLLLPLLHTIPEQISKINVTMGYPLKGTNIYAPIIYPERYDIDLSSTDLLGTIEKLRSVLKAHYSFSESEAYFQIQSVLTKVESLINDTTYKAYFFSEEQPVKFFFDILQMLTVDLTVSFTGDYLDGLQVMGVLESRALDFDNVIITSFNDDIYPGNSVSSNSFIPFILRRGFGLPTYERQDAIYAYNFYRLIAHAKEVYFISINNTDDNHSNEPSRYLYQLQYQYGYPIECTDMLPEAYNVEELEEIAKDETIMSKIREVIVEGHVSASMLNTYIKCPMMFYWQYIREVLPEKEEQALITPDKLGTIVHKVLKDFYSVQGRDINTLIDTYPETKDTLVRNLVFTLVDKLLRYDHHGTPWPDIESLEQVFTRELTLKDGTVIHLTGTIDRVDVVNDIVRIIDYKTGKGNVVLKDIEGLFTDYNDAYIYQVLFYCYLYEGTHPDVLLQPNLFAVRTDGTDKTALEIKVGRKTRPLDYQEVREVFERRLKTIISEILDPKTPFTVTEQRHAGMNMLCGGCGFEALCAHKNIPLS